jgi:hypothetical protein
VPEGHVAKNAKSRFNQLSPAETAFIHYDSSGSTPRIPTEHLQFHNKRTAPTPYTFSHQPSIRKNLMESREKGLWRPPLNR